MKKFALLVLLALMVSGIGVVAQQSAPSDDQLLQAFDDARFLQTNSFTMTMDIVADRPDGTKQATVQLYFKRDANGEQLFRIEILAPDDMKGQIYISNPDGTFFWQPGLASPLKVSARQQVFGDSSVAETAGIQFKGNYSVKARRDVTLSDGSAGIEVDLQANSSDIAFPSATVTADAKTLRPLKARLFALSGDPLNDVTYEEYADLNGDSYVKKQLIENQLVKTNKTLLTITNIEAKDLSNDLFDEHKLGQ
jgi:outer membrane lipoprotein-sorting protein